MAGSIAPLRRVAYNILEGETSDDRRCGFLQRFIIALIVLNGVAVILESNRGVYASYSEFFNAFELFSVTIFTIEYFGRVWTSTVSDRYAHMPAWRARVSYIFSPMALIDLLAILPFYLSLLIPVDLRYLRFFRLLRLLKLTHYFDGLKIFSDVLRREASAIAAALLTIIILIIVSACLMFTVENAAQPGQFSSITQAIWWAVVTLTTVGYGDITPITFGGKLLAIAIMLLGIGTMALPAGILAARFTEELQSRREYVRKHVTHALLDGELDDEERQSIELLQKKLGLSPDVVERMLSGQQESPRRHKYCSHCGEQLE